MPHGFIRPFKGVEHLGLMQVCFDLFRVEGEGFTPVDQGLLRIATLQGIHKLVEQEPDGGSLARDIHQAASLPKPEVTLREISSLPAEHAESHARPRLTRSRGHQIPQLGFRLPLAPLFGERNGLIKSPQDLSGLHQRRRMRSKNTSMFPS
jgi:hypothetical protein